MGTRDRVALPAPVVVDGLLEPRLETGLETGLLSAGEGQRGTRNAGHTTHAGSQAVGGDVVGDPVARDEVGLHPRDPGGRAAAAGAGDEPGLGRRAVGLDVGHPGLLDARRSDVVGVGRVQVDHVGPLLTRTGQVGRLLVACGNLRARRHARVRQTGRQHRRGRRCSRQSPVALDERRSTCVVPRRVLHTRPRTAGPVTGTRVGVRTEAVVARVGSRDEGVGERDARRPLGDDAAAADGGHGESESTRDTETNDAVHCDGPCLPHLGWRANETVDVGRPCCSTNPRLPALHERFPT